MSDLQQLFRSPVLDIICFLTLNGNLKKKKIIFASNEVLEEHRATSLGQRQQMLERSKQCEKMQKRKFSVS